MEKLSSWNREVIKFNFLNAFKTNEYGLELNKTNPPITRMNLRDDHARGLPLLASHLR